MNSQNSPHCCLPCVDNCVLIALMSCKRKRTKSTSCENKTKVKVADPCSLRSSAPTTIATALASSRGSSDVPDGVCTPSHDVALLIQRCDSVLAQHGAQGADQHLAAPRRVHARGLGGEQEVSASGIAQDGWAPGHSDDDTFTHIIPGARAVHRRVRVVRAAVAQSGLTLECASEELRGDREVVVVDAVLDGVQTTRLASRCGISTRRACHLDAASQGVGIVASPRVLYGLIAGALTSSPGVHGDWDRAAALVSEAQELYEEGRRGKVPTGSRFCLSRQSRSRFPRPPGAKGKGESMHAAPPPPVL